MVARTAKRIYTPAALEAWLERLAEPWERFFAPEELARGREMYRLGEVRELELGRDDAIAHCRLERQLCYAFLEWAEARLQVRSSTEDQAFGRALAAAGMYEIEELVADECSGLPEERSAPGPVVAPRPTPVPTAAAVENRSLHLQLAVTRGGLRLRAFWEEGRKLHPALADGMTGNGNLTEREREQLIRLTGLAHRAGFQYQAAAGLFLLREAERVQLFAREDLPVWRKHFAITEDALTASLADGPAPVDLALHLQEGAGGLRVLWRGSCRGRRLPDALAWRVVRAAGQAVFDPSWGLLRTPADRLADLPEWTRTPAGRAGDPLPFYLLFALGGDRRVPVELSESLAAWRERLLAPPAADDLPEYLRPYQRSGIRWMRHLLEAGGHALLADEMGLGKTLQALALLQGLHGRDDRPSLVVCPASVVPVWESEADRHFPALRRALLRNGHHWGSQPGPLLWLASYGQLRRHRALLGQVEFGVVILDEAQIIKNPEAKVSQACREVRARHRVALTGTPLENRPLDLWSLFEFLMPGLLGARRSVEEAGAGDDPAWRERWRAQLAPFILRRTKAQVMAELPPKTEMALICPLSTVQEREYANLSRRGLETLGDDLAGALRQRSLSLLTLLTRLRQVCCDPALLPWRSDPLEESGKLNLLREKLREILPVGGKVVIFSQFVRFLRRVQAALAVDFPDLPVLELTGQTTDRARPVADFQNRRGGAVILVSLKAGGLGITLHAADYAFLLDPWWNPAVEAQAIDRIHRLGQDKPVFIYRLITRGTVEERIERLKHRKRELFQELLQETRQPLDLTDHFRSLADLIALDPLPEGDAIAPPGDDSPGIVTPM